jgi:hypothetical protein
MRNANAHTTAPGGARPLDYAALGPRAPRRWRTPTLLEWFVSAAVALLLILFSVTVFCRPRINTTRGSCAANLWSVAQAVQMYADANGGRYPDALADTVRDGHAPDVRIFVCGGSADTPAAGVTPAARAADLAKGGHASYAYVGRGLTSGAHPDTVLAYEAADHHDGEGGHVLFADLRVEWHDAAGLRAIADWHAAGNGPMVYGKSGARPKPAPRPPTPRPAMEPVRRAAP